jgi:hypothetical protein
MTAFGLKVEIFKRLIEPCCSLTHIVHFKGNLAAVEFSMLELGYVCGFYFVRVGGT